MTNQTQNQKKEFSSLTKFAMVFGAVVFSVFLFMGVQVFSETRIGLTLFSNPDLEDGLVGHWTFDGPDMTSNVADRSGQGNHGSLIHGGSGTTTSPGTLGQALEFDGVDDQVDIPDPATSLSDAFTVAFWVKLKPGAANEYVPFVEKNGASSTNFPAPFDIRTGSGGFPKNANIVYGQDGVANNMGASNVFPQNEWVHVTVTADNTNGGILYIDGVQKDSDTNTTFSDEDQKIMIGQRLDNLNFAEAIIDDVRIYNRALSADEISRLYDLGATTHINTTITTNPDLEDGLVGHWTFDGPDMISNVADRSGQGNDGALQGQTSTSTAPGAIGQALDFDGTDDYVDMGNPVEMQITGNITVSAWIKTTDTDTSAILSKWDDSGSSDERAILFAVDNGGKVRFTLDASGTFSTVVNSYSSNTVSDDKWHHVIGVYDGSSAKVYVDGVEKGSNSYSSDIYNTPTNWEAGAMSDGSEWYFGGAIDDARIYNRALSADEISRLYDLGATTHINTTITTNPNLENGLVGHWSFDGPDMISNVADRSGQGNHGSLSGQTSTTTAIGVIGQALSFDGDDYVDVADDSTLDITDDTISFSAWIKPTELSANNAILTRGLANGIDTAYMLMRQGNNVRVEISNSSGNQGLRGDIVLVQDQWAHIVGVYDGSNISIYVDGVFDKSVSHSGNIVSRPESFRIGHREGSNEYFHGGVDDVRIYNRALSADEVQRLYNLGR